MLDVGDTFDIHTLTPEQVDDERYDPPLGPVIPVTIVGVTRAPAIWSPVPKGT